MISQGERVKESEHFNNIFIRGLPIDVTDGSLKEMFGKFGEITSSKIDSRDEKTASHFGYITFADSEHAKKAVKDMNMTKIGTNLLFVQRHFSKKEVEL